MTDHDKNEPAFPGGVNSVYTGIDPGEPTQPGMTLRDYLAAKAMQGDWAAEKETSFISQWAGDYARAAHQYYEMADAMLAARNESKKDE